MNRTVLRNDDLQKLEDIQRPLNEALRGIDMSLKSLPRREQAWLRFTMPIPTAGQLVKTPSYPLAAIVVLNAINASSSTSATSSTPWLAIEPVDGRTDTWRVTAAYGLLTSGVIDVLAEFVEDMTGGQNRSNPTGGQP